MPGKQSRFPHIKFYLHSHGQIMDLVPDLIDCGVDILNPILPLDNMDPVRLKRVYNIAMAAILAGVECFLLTRDPKYLELPRNQIRRVMAEGRMADLSQLPMSLRQHWIAQFAALGDTRESWVVPYRYADSGWFDWQPLVQAGTLGEHRFTEVEYNRLDSEYPGEVGAYAAPAVETALEKVRVDAPHFAVELPPGTEIRLAIGLERHANEASYRLPW